MMNTTMSEMSKASEITTTSEKHIQASGCVCAPANCEPKSASEHAARKHLSKAKPLFKIARAPPSADGSSRSSTPRVMTCSCS